MKGSIMGLVFGDEGKGKIETVILKNSLYLPAGQKYDAIVRYHGGANAGESYQHPKVPEELLISHQVPIGVDTGVYAAFLGGGLLHVERLAKQEIPELESKGLEVSRKTYGISGRNQVVLLHHLLEEKDNEEAGSTHFGTTGTGISTGYAHAAYKGGMTFAEFVGPNFETTLKRKVIPFVRKKFGNKYFGEDPVATYVEHYAPIRERLREFLRSESSLRREMRAPEKNVLIAGCQSIPLDVFFGANRYSSSSVTVNLPMNTDYRVGVMKSFLSAVQERRSTGRQKWITHNNQVTDKCAGRSGSGDEERGKTTGNKRDLGFMDAVLMKHSVDVGGIDTIAFTKADYLAKITEIGGGKVPIAIAYSHPSGRIEEFPDDSWVLEECEPEYSWLEVGPDLADPGQVERLREMREFQELDQESQDFFNRLGDMLGAEVGIVSTGPYTDQKIVRT